MTKILLKIFSVLLALLGIVLMITDHEGMGIVAVVLAIIVFPSERRGVKRESHRSNHYDDRDQDDENNQESNSGDSSSGSDSGGDNDD
ncbi:hypothetical protein R4Z09_26390 [Niallia oryzisoli]|uniref:Uncharacterized protein n=1 Tax=Niallia oryzisoli TaxID=1737571 RepID=A0ABZ2CG19_9BACI